MLDTVIYKLRKKSNVKKKQCLSKVFLLQLERNIVVIYNTLAKNQFYGIIDVLRDRKMSFRHCHISRPNNKRRLHAEPPFSFAKMCESNTMRSMEGE